MQPRVGQAGFLLASSFVKKQTTTTKPEQIVNLLITNFLTQRGPKNMGSMTGRGQGIFLPGNF